MLDLHDFENRPYVAALDKQRRRAFTALILERAILHGWRLFYWLLFFAGIWMLQIPEFLGTYARYGFSAAFFAGLLYLINKDILSFQMPSRENLDQAIEQKSGLTQGYIGLLHDRLANPKTAGTRALWQDAQLKTLHSFKRLRSPSMRAQLCREDPSALRYIAILLFISGIAFSGVNWQHRIFSGMMPFAPSWSSVSEEFSANLWVTTPEYTQMGEYHILGSPNETSLNIPQDSKIRVRMHTAYGEWFPPRLKNGNKIIELSPLGDNLYGTEATIEEGSSLQIVQGIFTRDTWHYDFIEDQPPEIWLPKEPIEKIDTKNALHSKKSILEENSAKPDTGEEKSAKNDPAQKQDKNSESESSGNETSENSPDLNSPDRPPSEIEQADSADQKEPLPPYEVMANLSLRFSLNVKDDYSVKELGMKMDLDPLVEDRPLGDPVSKTRLVMSMPNEEFLIAPVFDMTWHTWAGLPVQFTFEAIDHEGQKETLEPISFILPEREFEHPMAKSLIAMRKRLAWDYLDSFFEISRNLETLLKAPDYFQNDPVIFLAIRSASSRLFHNFRANDEIKTKVAREVIALLWEAALVVEDGNLSLAMRNLRNAQRRLEDAMRDPNSSEEEIAELMDEMREKMNEYFKEMQREMQKRIENGEMPPPMAMENFDQLISPDILSEMMKEIEQALRDGDQEKAQDLMSKMQRMMEMMDPSMHAQMPQDMQMMEEGINELQQLIENQEELLMQTRRYSKMLEQLEKTEKSENLQPPSPKTEEQTQIEAGREQRSAEQKKSDPGQEIEDMLKEFGFDVTPPKPKAYNPPPRETTKNNGSNEKQPEEDMAEGEIPENLEETVSTSKTEQEALRYILGQLMLEASEKLKEVPEKMGLAEQEMRGSSDSLKLSDAGRSIPHQEQAIEYLKQAQEDLQQQLQKRMQQMIGITMSRRRSHSNDEGNYDPLGRPYGGEESSDGDPNSSEVEVPDEAQKKRVDEILKTLRDRSGERYRSRDELDYFRRLLRQFQ